MGTQTLTRLALLLRYYPVLSRWEFLPAVIIGFTVGLLWGLANPAGRLQPGVLAAGLFALFLHFNSGFMVNCLADRQVDQIYKSRLSSAIFEIGPNVVGWFVALHLALMLRINFYLSQILDRPVLAVVAIFAVGMSLAYSCPPIRFKGNPYLHPLMALPVFWIPGVMTYLLVSPLEGAGLFLALSIGITMNQYALVLVNQAEDVLEDRESGLVTPVVKWGLQKAMNAALWLTLGGTALVLAAFSIRFLSDGPLRLFLVCLPVLAVLLNWPNWAIGRLARIIRGRDERTQVALIRADSKKIPVWHGIGLLGISLCSLLGLL